jgi:hypothetical protein
MSIKRRGLCHSLLLAAVIVLAPATLDGQDT